MFYAWSPQYIADLTGKSFLITGGCSGVGLEVTRALLRRGARVVIASRSRDRVDAAIGTLRALLPSACVFGLVVDLASFSSIDALVASPEVAEHPLHGLINNASLVLPPHSRTAEGFEVRVKASGWTVASVGSLALRRALFPQQVTLGTNYLGPAYLTLKLLPLLRTSGAASDGPSRIVCVSTNVPHLFARGLRKHLLARNVGGCDATASGPELYALSKAYNVLFARALHGRLAAQQATEQVQSFFTHPGFVSATGQSKVQSLFSAALRLVAPLALPTDRGAYSTLFACTALNLHSGSGFGPNDLNRGLTNAWTPRGDLFASPGDAETLFAATCALFRARGLSFQEPGCTPPAEG